MDCTARPAAFMLEEHTRFTTVPITVGGRPALIMAWVAGACKHTPVKQRATNISIIAKHTNYCSLQLAQTTMLIGM